jgi:hypothetical protein
MNLRERLRGWSRPLYFLGQNPVTLAGTTIATSTALTTIAFWFYEILSGGLAGAVVFAFAVDIVKVPAFSRLKLA